MTATASPSRQNQPHRWGTASLRLRFGLAILLWVVLGIGAIGLSATRLFTAHVEAQYHEELEVHIHELSGLVHQARDGSLTMIRPLSDPRYQVPLSGFYWQVSGAGFPQLRSASMTRGSLDEEVAHSTRVLHRVENGPTGPAIVYGLARRGTDGRVIHFVIATDQRLLDATISSFTSELTLWLVLLGLTLIATGIAVVVIGLRPFDRLAHAISRLRAGDSPQLAGSYPSEIAPLVDDLNAYIAHTGKAVERGRVEAGNLAHALRTPLAVITDEAERLAATQSARRSGEILLEQSRVMADQIHFRLARARSVGASGLAGSVCRLSDVLPPILAAMRRLHTGVEFRVTPDDGQDVVLPVDPVDMSELLSNLLDNAGKWARQCVTIELGSAGGTAIAISDDGPGMTADQIAMACEIGTRFDDSKPGSGLGLAITQDIAEACGLQLVLAPKADGSNGLQASLLLPA